jgi:hypothetical protein
VAFEPFPCLFSHYWSHSTISSRYSLQNFFVTQTAFHSINRACSLPSHFIKASLQCRLLSQQSLHQMQSSDNALRSYSSIERISYFSFSANLNRHTLCQVSHLSPGHCDS